MCCSGKGTFPKLASRQGYLPRGYVFYTHRAISPEKTCLEANLGNVPLPTSTYPTISGRQSHFSDYFRTTPAHFLTFLPVPVLFMSPQSERHFQNFGGADAFHPPPPNETKSLI